MGAARRPLLISRHVSPVTRRSSAPDKSPAQIHAGTDAPADAYVAVQYKGYWHWIDDTDIASKRIFTFLMILFSLAETGQTTAAPVVTVPSR
jgi:hypothetical protein